MVVDAAWADQLTQLAPFAPYVKVSRQPGERTYIELEAPPDVAEEAVKITFRCHNDSRPMHPFRERQGQGGRQWERGGVFFAASCDKPGCSRSPGASVALKLAADFFDGTAANQPKAELMCPRNAFTGLHIPRAADPTRCSKCGGRLL